MQIDDWAKVYRDLVHQGDYMERKLNVLDRWHRLIMHMVEQANLDLRHMNILEVGCGVGAFTSWLSHTSDKATGVDIAPEALMLGKVFSKRFGWNLSFILASGHRLPVQTGIFDVTVSTETLEHIPNFLWVFDEIIRVTKPNGYIIVTVPNYMNLTSRDWVFQLKRWLKLAEKQPDDVNHFTIYTLATLMETRRLKPIILRGVGLIQLPFERGLASKIQKYYIDYPVSRLKALSRNIGFIAQKV